MKLELPRLIWYGNSTLEIELPDTWDVEILPMRGAARRPLSAAEIEHAVTHPIGSPRLRELARNKKSAVVIFDDITRPTRVSDIAPRVIGELVAGGIGEEAITFVCALGNHGAHTNHELRKKLGAEILERFRVFNHNPYEHCLYVGETSQGTKLLVNREVMESEVRVGIGCVTAHINTGFSGGGKIIMPGVSHIDSAAHYHMEISKNAPESTGLGNFDDNVMYKDIREAATLAGLDFKVDAVVNERGQTTALFAGSFIDEHMEAVKLAREVYAVHPPRSAPDVVIANAFAKANEMFIAVHAATLALGAGGGTVVVIADAPEGQIPHYLQRGFGRSHGGRQYPIAEVPPGIELVVVAPRYDRNFADWVKNPEVIRWTKEWRGALDILTAKFGPRLRAAVLPEATIIHYDSSPSSS